MVNSFNEQLFKYNILKYTAEKEWEERHSEINELKGRYGIKTKRQLKRNFSF